MRASVDRVVHTLAPAPLPPVEAVRPPAPLLLAGAGRAAVAVGGGLVAAESLALVSWATGGPITAPAADALRVGADGWLLAHGASVAVAGGRLSLAPLGVTLLAALLCARAGGRLAADRYLGFVDTRQACRVALAVGPAYGVLAGALAVVAGVPSARPAVPTSFLAAGALAAAAAFAGAVATRADPGRGALLPASVRLALRAALAGCAVLAAGGAVLGAGLVAARIGAVAHVADQLDAGAPGGVGLLVLQVTLVPDLVVWAAAYCVGAGFAVGAGTSVSVTGVRLGSLPALPVLAGLPAPGRPPAAVLVVLLVPAAAGILVGLVVHRGAPGRRQRRTGSLLVAGGGLVGAAWGRLRAADLVRGGPAGAAARRALPAAPAALGRALVARTARGVATWRRALPRRRAAADRPRVPGDSPRTGGWRACAGAALAGGGATGLLAAAAAALSGGAAGPGRLAVVGPSPWQTGLFTAAEVAAAAVVTVLVCCLRRTA